MVPSYIPKPVDFARPADFREQHAALNTFLSRPQSPTLFDIAQVAGILVHGPAGRAFNEDMQKLGFLRFCVPSQDYKRGGRWVFRLKISSRRSTRCPRRSRRSAISRRPSGASATSRKTKMARDRNACLTARFPRPSGCGLHRRRRYCLGDRAVWRKTSLQRGVRTGP